MFYVRLALYFIRYKIKKNLNYCEDNDFLPMDERSSKAVELGAFSFIPVYIILETLYKEKGIIFNRLFISLTYPKTYLLRRDSWKNTDHQFFKSSILLHTFSYISRVK